MGLKEDRMSMQMNANNSMSYMLCTYCVTYNHESYITYALNGFVMQQTGFPVVCTIVDDASTDKMLEMFTCGKIFGMSDVMPLYRI